MTETTQNETPEGRVSLAPLNPEDALRALLQVDPDAEPVEPEDGGERQPHSEER